MLQRNIAVIALKPAFQECLAIVFQAAGSIWRQLRSTAGRSTLAGGLFLARVYAQIVQFAFFLVVARFIGVADFGTFSLLFAFALGLSLLAEGGWREYLICHDEEPLIRRSYGLAITISTAIFVLIASIAILFWLIGPHARLAPTIFALALWVPFRSLATLEAGRLTKAGHIHRISIASIVSETAGCLAGLAALWAGKGILALGVSKLVLEATALIWLMRGQERVRCQWRRQPHDREMMAFAGQILVGRFASFLSGNSSVFVIGFGLSPVAVGFYRASTRVAGAAAEALREPARVIFWSTMKKADGEDRRAARVRSAENSAWYLFCVAAPVFVLMAELSEPLILTLLGERWVPAAPIISILAVAYLIGFITTLSEPVFSLDNQPGRARELAISAAIMSVVATILAVPFGLHAVAWAQLGANVLIATVTLWSLRVHGDFASYRLLRRLAAPAAGVFAMVLALWFLESRGAVNALPHILQILALGTAGILIYAVVTGVFILNAVHRRTVPAR